MAEPEKERTQAAGKAGTDRDSEDRGWEWTQNGRNMTQRDPERSRGEPERQSERRGAGWERTGSGTVDFVPNLASRPSWGPGQVVGRESKLGASRV